MVSIDKIQFLPRAVGYVLVPTPLEYPAPSKWGMCASPPTWVVFGPFTRIAAKEPSPVDWGGPASDLFVATGRSPTMAVLVSSFGGERSS